MTEVSASPACRACGAAVTLTFADLGLSPIANANPRLEQAQSGEVFYPLHALVCSNCLLVQLEEFESRESIFDDDYTYFSSYSTSWVEHARRFAESMTTRLNLGPGSRVVEVASNDGYLLQHFLPYGIEVLGVEPTANTAAAAAEKGIPSRVEFFGEAVGREIGGDGGADLLVGNNVFAHVPDLGDFTRGLKAALAPNGVLSLEFPHLMTLIADKQWDTIYHEHFSYFSLRSARFVLEANGLRVFDVERLPTHGGSLRLLACHAEDSRAVAPGVAEVERLESGVGLDDIETYTAFDAAVKQDKMKILETVFELKRAGKRIVGYGAPAKGNTMLNFCGIGRDIIDFTCDLSPHKQGRLLPGSRIPILPPKAISESRPDIVWILPWNLRAEIIEQMSVIEDWGGSFLCRAPDLRVFEPTHRAA